MGPWVVEGKTLVDSLNLTGHYASSKNAQSERNSETHWILTVHPETTDDGCRRCATASPSTVAARAACDAPSGDRVRVHARHALSSSPPAKQTYHVLFQPEYHVLRTASPVSLDIWAEPRENPTRSKRTWVSQARFPENQPRKKFTSKNRPEDGVCWLRTRTLPPQPKMHL